MILKAKELGAQGKKAKVYDGWGLEVNLWISEYNTETKEATFYIPVKKQADADPSVARTAKKYNDVQALQDDKDGKPQIENHKEWECDVITATVTIPDSYAEIDGERV